MEGYGSGAVGKSAVFGRFTSKKSDDVTDGRLL
jgi:hypothetical protein